MQEYLRGKIDTLKGYRPFDVEQHNALLELYTNEVLPFVLPNPSILIVGPGQRTEELTAAIDVFSPKCLVGAEPDINSFSKLKGQLETYNRKFRPIVQQIELIQKPFSEINDIFDLVMGFSITNRAGNIPYSRGNFHWLHKLLNKSRSTAIISSNLPSEIEAINTDLSQIGEWKVIINKESCYENLSDWHLWVLEKE